MDLDLLRCNLNICGEFGQIVSTEEGMVLQHSLLLLQNENHFRSVYFWGRIYGVDNDYFVAYGYIKDALTGKIFYYSTNCQDWGLMPKSTEQSKMLTLLCTAKFQGDAAIVHELALEGSETMFGATLNPGRIYRLKEEDRLAATVALINEQAVIVPRGALFKRPDDVVVENLSFKGLDTLDALETASYQHYRIPTEKWNVNLLTRDDYNYAVDFLDTIAMDIPTGCWSIQITGDGTMVVLKPMYWPGYYFYHRIKLETVRLRIFRPRKEVY